MKAYKAITLYKHVIEEMSIVIDLKMVPKISRDIYYLKKNSLHLYRAYIRSYIFRNAEISGTLEAA